MLVLEECNLGDGSFRSFVPFIVWPAKLPILAVRQNITVHLNVPES
jgi:hypothetical protein